MGPRIFINYRRGDDPGFTQALYQRLEHDFPREDLFMDIEGHIKPGDDFVEVLNARVAESDVFLAVIGERWANLMAARARDPHDYVTLEILAALDQHKWVIPVLVGGAGMPTAEVVPESIHAFVRLQAVTLRPDRFTADCRALIAALKEPFKKAEEEWGQPPQESAAEQHIDKLVADHLLERGIEPRGRAHYQYAVVVQELMRSVATLHPPSSHADKLNAIVSLVESFASTCDPKFWESEERQWLRVLWRHRDLTQAMKEGTESTEACRVDKFVLSEIALDYLRQDARSGEFERLLVDALVGTETWLFGEEIKKHPSRFERSLSLDPLTRDMEQGDLYHQAKGNLDKLYWLRLKSQAKKSWERLLLFFAAPIAAIIAAGQLRIDWLATLSWTFLALVITFYVVRGTWRLFSSRLSARKTGLQRALELFRKMVQAYDEIRGPATSPTRCREVFAKLADEGAGWDPSVFTILDGAIRRSPARWE